MLRSFYFWSFLKFSQGQKKGKKADEKANVPPFV